MTRPAVTDKVSPLVRVHELDEVAGSGLGFPIAARHFDAGRLVDGEGPFAESDFGGIGITPNAGAEPSDKAKAAAQPPPFLLEPNSNHAARSPLYRILVRRSSTPYNLRRKFK